MRPEVAWYLEDDEMFDNLHAEVKSTWPFITNLDLTIRIDVSERMGLQMNGECFGPDKLAYQRWRSSANL